MSECNLVAISLRKNSTFVSHSSSTEVIIKGSKVRKRLGEGRRCRNPDRSPRLWSSDHNRPDRDRNDSLPLTPLPEPVMTTVCHTQNTCD